MDEYPKLVGIGRWQIKCDNCGKLKLVERKTARNCSRRCSTAQSRKRRSEREFRERGKVTGCHPDGRVMM